MRAGAPPGVPAGAPTAPPEGAAPPPCTTGEPSAVPPPPADGSTLSSSPGSGVGGGSTEVHPAGAEAAAGALTGALARTDTADEAVQADIVAAGYSS